MPTQTSAAPLRRRIRLSFDIDISYRKLPLDVQDRELEKLQSLLLARPDLMDKLYANQCLRALEEVMEGMAREGGLLGYSEQDLLAAAARRASSEDILPLLVASSNSWDFEYTDPVLNSPIEAQVTGMQAEDIATGDVLDLSAPQPSLVQCKSRRYLIAETENASLAAACVFHSARPSGAWMRDTRRTIDLLAEDASRLSHPLAAIEFTVYAAAQEEYDAMRADIEWYCGQRLPGVKLSFGWFTLFGVELPETAQLPVG